MARNVTIYKVFIASPSDLSDERSLIEEVIDEINISTFHNSDIKVELVKWETHSNPDIGSYPQQVINNDIGDDYDIFIGLLWSRFGSPTDKYGSGTEEEFYRAYSLYKKSPSSINIMFYFKQAPIPFNKIDTESINSIRKFRIELGEKGLLYWEYNSVEEFQKLLRIQLTRKIQEIKQSNKVVPVVVEKEEIVSKEEELGLLDYVEIGEESFDDIEEIVDRMTAAINWIGDRFVERTEEINKQTSLNTNLGTKAKKRLINKASDDMNLFNKRLSVEIPLFSEIYKKGIDSFSNALKISVDIKADEIEDIENTIESLDSFIEAILGSSDTCVEFKNSMTEFPRMTKEFNQSKRVSADLLNQLISEFDSAVNLGKALKTEFEEYKAMY